MKIVSFNPIIVRFKHYEVSLLAIFSLFPFTNINDAVVV